MTQSLMFFMLLIAFTFQLSHESQKLGVYPSSIHSNIDEKFTIICRVNDNIEGFLLNFYDNDYIFGNSVALDNNTIQLTHSFDKPTRATIYCLLDNKFIGYTAVNVDEKPAHVTGFKCQTNNLMKMTCVFSGNISIMPITYKFFFKLMAPHKTKKKQCNLQKDKKQSHKCVINLQNLPDDYQNLNFKFTIDAENSIGISTTIHRIPFLKTIVPPKLINLVVVEAGDEKNLLYLQMSQNMTPIIELLQFQSEYKHNVGYDIWTRFKMAPLVTDKGIVCDLHELNKPFTNYTLRLRTKVKIVKRKAWSKYAKISFETKPKIPTTAPVTCLSCHQRLNNGSVILYWKEISEIHQNGPEFGYLVVGTNSNSEFMRSSAKNAHFLVEDQPKGLLSYSIYAVNSAGVSKNFSQVIINNSGIRYKSRQAVKRLSVQKILIQKNFYHLSWYMMEDLSLVKSYTIYWCDAMTDKYDVCEGSLDFEEIDPSYYQVELKMEKETNFAVSVNYHNSIYVSMVWAKFSVPVPKTNISRTSKSLKFTWKKDVFENGFPHSYNISYCPVRMHPYAICIDLWKHFHLYAFDVMVAQLQDLQPYQFYKIRIEVISDCQNGPVRFFYENTLPTEPTPPTNQKIIGIGTTSIKLSWQKPKEVNGPNLFYHIWFNDSSRETSRIYSNSEKIVTYELTDLTSDTLYNIQVLACNYDGMRKFLCSSGDDKFKVTTEQSFLAKGLASKIGQLASPFTRWFN